TAVEAWFKILIEQIYPRFLTEKHRFDLDFFITKAEQVLLRFTLLHFFSLLFLHYLFKKEDLKFWNISISSSKVVFLQIWLSVVWAYESLTWYKSLLRLGKASAFYEPYFLLKIFDFPSETTLFWLFGALYLLLVLSFVPKISVWAWSTAVILLLILQGFLYGFGKIDHTYTTWAYVSTIFLFLLQEKNKSETNETNAWALRLMQVVIAMVYLQTGIEKLLIGGLNWFEPATMQTHLLAHPTTIGLFLANSELICVLMSIFVMVLEIGFPLILFYPKLKIPILLMGLAFHTGTFVLLGVGGFPSLWWLIYIIWFLEFKTNNFKFYDKNSRPS
ncbi:MAG: HTTM domain-containing protein, partial [Thermonemataceae bacterium]|nr:HTTM domain-containing protein [Thermonemataceae bacterium]